MVEKPPDHDRPAVGGPELSPQESLLRKTVSARLIVVILLAFLVGSGGVAGGYFLGHGRSTRPVNLSARGTGALATPTATVSVPGQASRAASTPQSAVPTQSVIRMSLACEWAYPAHASGKFSGDDYSIVCLGTGGQVLGGFSGSHSLNAWCADPRHTGNKSLPSPVLIDGEWLCSA